MNVINCALAAKKSFNKYIAPNVTKKDIYVFEIDLENGFKKHGELLQKIDYLTNIAKKYRNSFSFAKKRLLETQKSRFDGQKVRLVRVRKYADDIHSIKSYRLAVL